jgi:hypothetical protein
VPNLLMLASGMGLVAATAALWVQGWRRADHRFFAGLISIAVTLSLFSVVAWAATAIAPLPLTWVLVGMLALLFALRLYRELQEPRRANVLLSRASSNWRRHITWPADPHRLEPGEDQDENVGDDADARHGLRIPGRSEPMT